MPDRVLVVDVFAREPLGGNALAVFPDAASIDPARMQRIAREFNLSETTFVTRAEGSSYDVRIFTPFEEMPFAGHPTLGTAWTLRHLGVVSGDTVVQSSPAGETPVTFEGTRVWLERGGDPGSDLEDFDEIVAALDIDPADVGFDAAAIGGRPAALQPAIADAGVPIPIVPMGDPDRVARLVIPHSPRSSTASIASHRSARAASRCVSSAPATASPRTRERAARPPLWVSIWERAPAK